MPKHIESIVTRMPIRDADRFPSACVPSCSPSSRTRAPRPLVPVCDLPDLAPEERVAELRIRVRSGMYGSREVVEQVARRLVLEGREFLG